MTNIPDYQQKIESSLASLRDQDMLLGDIILKRQRELPPFDFYTKKPEKQSVSQYSKLFMPKILAYNAKNRPMQSALDDLILKAQELSWNGNTDKAVIIYDAFIKEKYPYYKPYNLLISIYQKNKDLNGELQAVKQAIRFFTDFKEEQKNYVLALAADCKCELKALQSIVTRKKILYYADAFVLYDPALILDQWQKRLEFLTRTLSCCGQM
jgi:tetratricopeptide (TPR) repeat protein